jgi:hypothetical protein
MPRDEFPEAVKQQVAARVGRHCSNPECQRLTSGPAADPARAVNVGVAAHITAAAPGGPRFAPQLPPEIRASAGNAIWLCQTCAALVDRDEDRFTPTVLREWRQRAEDLAARAIGAGSRFRSIAANEVRQEQSLGTLAAIKALEEEFGCHVEADVHVPAGQGWVWFDGAVVRGEDLIAIDIRENHGQGVAYFQIEYMIELCRTLKFDRFQNCVFFLVVVSDGPTDADTGVEQRVRALADRAGIETYVRMFRLNELRARFNM